MDGIDDIHAAGDFAEDRVTAVQMRLSRMGDEKLAAIGAGAGVGHRKNTGAVVTQGVAGKFVLEAVARAAAAGAGGISPLDDKIWNDAVEDNAVIKAFTGQKYKIIYCNGCILGIQFDFDNTFVGVYFCCVFFFRINL